MLAPFIYDFLMELNFLQYEGLFISKGYDRDEALHYIQRNDLFSHNINKLHANMMWSKIEEIRREKYLHERLNAKIHKYLQMYDCPKLKIIMVGVGRVGKSSLFKQYYKRDFDVNTRITLGIDCVDIGKMYGDKVINITFCDPSGQEKIWDDLPLDHFKTANGCIGICSLDVPNSLTQLENRYLSKIRQYNPECKIVLACNKVDEREYWDKFNDFQEQIERFRKNNFAKYKIFYISAKSGHNVAKAIDEVVFQILNNWVAEIEKIGTKERDKKIAQIVLVCFFLVIAFIAGARYK